MLAEMLLLSYFANKLYKRELPMSKLKEIKTVGTTTDFQNKTKTIITVPTGKINRGADLQD